jgi:putative spermidine/putrescine transport system permease protein
MTRLDIKRPRDAALLALLLLPGVGVILALVGTVIGMAVAQSFGFFNISGESAFSLAHWHKQLSSRILGISVLYSLRVALISAVLSVVLAYPIAVWLRKPFFGSTTLSAVIKAPMLVPGLVAAFLYINVVAYHGIINETLVGLGMIDGPLRMQNDRYGVGVLILQVWKNMPFALLLLVGAVQSIHPDLLDAARDLRAGAWARFRRIILPLTVRSMQAALIIIFIGAAGDYSFQTVVGPANTSSMSQYMYTVQQEFGNWNEAAVIAVVLMIIAFVGSLLLALVAGLLGTTRKG